MRGTFLTSTLDRLAVLLDWLKRYTKLDTKRVLAIVGAVGITAAIIIFQEQLAQLGSYGYLGVFIISLLGNATLILPAPYFVAVFGMGSVLNPWGVGIVAGLGAALGEMTGYMAGYAGGALIENVALYERTVPYIRRFGPLAIFVLAAIPNPLFDVGGIAAGAVRMPVWLFILSCWAGKAVRLTLVAWSGAGLFTLFGL
jgi:membrane protein YqaA with SNARE-associated domain